AAGPACPAFPPESTRLRWNRFDVVEAVMAGTGATASPADRVGTLYIRRGLGDLYARLRVGAATIVVLMLLAMAGGFLIAARMQRAIAAPLRDLAETARTISTSRDYAIRAVPASSDEIGVVVHAFNDMLDRIADRTAELSK